VASGLSFTRLRLIAFMLLLFGLSFLIYCILAWSVYVSTCCLRYLSVHLQVATSAGGGSAGGELSYLLYTPGGVLRYAFLGFSIEFGISME
jgi:hypothetical protein